jgi:hypothetical protein
MRPFALVPLRKIGTEDCLLWCVCRLTPSGRGDVTFKDVVNNGYYTIFHKLLKNNSYTFFADKFTAMFKPGLNTEEFRSRYNSHHPNEEDATMPDD